MSSRWLNIPLQDYEGHMSSPGVEQLAPLAALFRLTLERVQPPSLAILGIAGGNGLDAIDPATTHRIIGIDLNASYLDAVSQRFPNLPGLELHLHDLASQPIPCAPVHLVYAALVFEHAGTGLCLENALSLCLPGGHIAVVLQLPSQTQAGVAPTPFASLQSLKETFQLVDPAWLTATLSSRDFSLRFQTELAVPSGKAFWLGLFDRSSAPAVK